MADHSKPSTTSTYANYTAEIDARFDDLAVGLDPAVTTATNLPTNSQRWSSAAGKWQKWNGSSWGDLASTYNISISGSAGSVDWANVANKPSSLVQSDGNTYNLSITGSAQSLATARTINGVSFNGTANINVNTVTTCTFNNSGAGNASGIAFDGGSARTISYNTIGAPSVTGANAIGTWGISISGSSATCTGNASTASTLQTARTINGASFNGSANVNIEPYVETDSANANRYVVFVDANSDSYQRLNSSSGLVYNPSTNTLNCTASSVPWSGIVGGPIALVGTYTATLSFNNWVNINIAEATNEYASYAFLIYWNDSSLSYYRGSDIFAGSVGMVHSYATTDYRVVNGAGSYGERLYYRHSFGSATSGSGLDMNFYYYGRAGFYGTTTAPVATIVVYKLFS